MKNNKGISLITLTVTIIVMIILIGVVGVYSLDTIKRGHSAVARRELENVRNFVIRQSLRLDTNDFVIDVVKYPDIELSSEKTYALTMDKLSEQEINNIVSVNSSELDAKYKYYYIQATEKHFEDLDFSNNDITVRDVKYDYIINFYTGTIICVSDGFFSVDGIVKGLDEIELELAK